MMFAPDPGTVATIEVAWGADVRLVRAKVLASYDNVIRLEPEDDIRGIRLGQGDHVLARWNTAEGACTARAAVRSITQTGAGGLVVELPHLKPERRVRTRTEGNWDCRCTLDDDYIEDGAILELGIGGARMTVNAPEVEVGNRIGIRIDNATISGRVVGIVHPESGVDELRVRFEDLGLEDLIAIGELVGNPFPRKPAYG